MTTDTPPTGVEPMLRLLRMLPAATRTEMVGMYLNGLDEQLRSLQRLLDGGVAPTREQVRPVHTLAGSAAMMQDGDLSRPARAIEHALLAGDLDGARALWPALEAAAARSVAALARA